MRENVTPEFKVKYQYFMFAGRSPFQKMKSLKDLESIYYVRPSESDIIIISERTLMSPASGPSISKICRALAIAKITPCIAGVSIIWKSKSK